MGSKSFSKGLIRPHIHLLNEIEEGEKHLIAYTDSSNLPINVLLFPGKYKFDLWGASGYDIRAGFSLGAHVSGFMTLNISRTFYLYPGEMGKEKGGATFNGGGSGPSNIGCSGGGATDIRLVPGNFNDFSSLMSRIIVAGGGGGYINSSDYPDDQIFDYGQRSNGGTLAGGTGVIKKSPGNPNSITLAEGGTQTHGGARGKRIFCESGCTYTESGDGSFGVGGQANTYYGGGGGGGYFGGGGGHVVHGVIGSGGGGSSFVSGCDDCVSYSHDSSYNNMIPLDTPIHYSNIYFTNIEMHSGFDEFASPSGSLESGHLGHGSILISHISFKKNISLIQCYYSFSNIILFLTSIIINSFI